MKKVLKTLALCCLFMIIGIVIGSSSKRLLEETFSNNGLKELSREEVVESYSSNFVKVVLDGKVEDCRNFESTIRKEAEHFIKNYEKYPSSDEEFPNAGGENIYKVKYRTIEISAEDMEMYARFRYGESSEGKWITFDSLDNNVSMKKNPETNEEIENLEEQDTELRLLLSELEKSLNEKYGGIMYK